MDVFFFFLLDQLKILFHLDFSSRGVSRRVVLFSSLTASGSGGTMADIIARTCSFCGHAILQWYDKADLGCFNVIDQLS